MTVTTKEYKEMERKRILEEWKEKNKTTDAKENRNKNLLVTNGKEILRHDLTNESLDDSFKSLELSFQDQDYSGQQASQPPHSPASTLAQNELHEVEVEDNNSFFRLRTGHLNNRVYYTLMKVLLYTHRLEYTLTRKWADYTQGLLYIIFILSFFNNVQ